MESVFTEHHPGHPIEPIHPSDISKEIIPKKPHSHVANALMAGLRKHPKWDSSAPAQKYWGHFENHYKAYHSGEVFDSEDGQHHVAAMIVRLYQILDKEAG